MPVIGASTCQFIHDSGQLGLGGWDLGLCWGDVSMGLQFSSRGVVFPMAVFPGLPCLGNLWMSPKFYAKFYVHL